MPKKLLFDEVNGLCPPGHLGLVLMMLHYMIVKTVVLVGLTGMHKTDCTGETRLVLHVASSSWAGKHFTCYYHTIKFSEDNLKSTVLSVANILVTSKR